MYLICFYLTSLSQAIFVLINGWKHLTIASFRYLQLLMFVPSSERECTSHLLCAFLSRKLTAMRNAWSGDELLVWLSMCTTQLMIDPLPLYDSGFLSFTWGTCTELCACGLSWIAALFWFALYKAWVICCAIFCDLTSSARIYWIACCSSRSCWVGDCWCGFGALGFIPEYLYFRECTPWTAALGPDNTSNIQKLAWPLWRASFSKPIN